MNRPSAADDERLVELAVFPNEAIATAMRPSLQDAGVDADYSPAHDRVPPFGVSVGTPVRVRVPANQYGRARAALNDAEAGAVDIDWDTEDLGAPEDPDAAAIAARDGATDADWARAEQLRKAKQLRATGFACIAVAAGCAFALAGMPQILFIILAVLAVWLGRAHAISRRRRQTERLLRHQASEKSHA